MVAGLIPNVGEGIAVQNLASAGRGRSLSRTRRKHEGRKHLDAAVDPRIERSQQLILHAALEELGEVGYGAFTVESVAARSGVAKSTIYRHWSDKLTLIADAFQTFHEQSGPDITSGSAREKLDRILRHVAEVVGKSLFSACIPALIEGAERDPGLREFHHRFQMEARKPLVAVLAEGVASGEFLLHVNPDIAASALLGLVFYRRLMTREPFDPERAGDVINTMLGFARPLRGSRAASRKGTR